MRCWLGRLCFVFEYNLHIWIPNGSRFCNSSGVRSSVKFAVEARSAKSSWEKMVGRSREDGERSSLVSESRVLPEVRDWTVDDDTEELCVVIDVSDRLYANTSLALL